MVHPKKGLTKPVASEVREGVDLTLPTYSKEYVEYIHLVITRQGRDGATYCWVGRMAVPTPEGEQEKKGLGDKVAPLGRSGSELPKGVIRDEDGRTEKRF